MINKKLYIQYSIILICVIGFVGCTTSGISQKSQESVFTSGTINTYARVNLPSFTQLQLKNGIPVIIKSTSNEIVHVRLVLEGGSFITNEYNAGIELLALKSMALSSKKYSYDAINDICSKTSSTFFSDANFDNSYYSLTTLGKYTDKTLDVWLDTIVNPVFDSRLIQQAFQDFKVHVEGKLQEPWATTIENANLNFFKNHAYKHLADGTEKSANSITLDQIKDFYNTFFSTNRMYVIVVGNVDPVVLEKKLNETLGSLSTAKIDVPSVNDMNGLVDRNIVKVNFNQSKDIAYIRGNFAAPNVQNKEYMSFNLGLKMLDDILFEIVRTKNSACYSVGSRIFNYKANYGMIYVYKTQVPHLVKPMIDQAISILASGKTLSVDPDAKELYQPIEKTIDFYKKQFQTMYFEALQSNADIALSIQKSISLSGDYRYYLLDLDRINAITSSSIPLLIKKYLIESPILWVAVGPENLLSQVSDNEFKMFVQP